MKILTKKGWSSWKSFPDKDKEGYLNAPIGLGVYQLRNTKDKKYKFTLFGRSKMVAFRMTSLILGLGGTRNNIEKRNYVSDNLSNIEYRTFAFKELKDAKKLEKDLKKYYGTKHRFRT